MERYIAMETYRWPFRAFIKRCWHYSASGLLIYFPMLMYRKWRAFRYDFQAPYGVRYPHQFAPLELDSIPPVHRNRLEARMRECQELGFGEAHSLEIETIGRVKHYLIVLIESEQKILFQLAWNLSLPDNEDHWKLDYSIAFTSALETGGAISSSADLEEDGVPDFTAHDVQAWNYPVSTSLNQLYELHRQVIPIDAKLKRFDGSTILPYLQERLTRLSKEWLQKGYYYELSPEQVADLSTTEFPPIN